MIHREYDPDCISVQDAAAVLEVDSTYVSRLLKNGQLSTHQNNDNRKFITEADLLSYMSNRLPTGYIAQASSNLLSR